MAPPTRISQAFNATKSIDEHTRLAPGTVLVDGKPLINSDEPNPVDSEDGKSSAKEVEH